MSGGQGRCPIGSQLKSDPVHGGLGALPPALLQGLTVIVIWAVTRAPLVSLTV